MGDAMRIYHDAILITPIAAAVIIGAVIFMVWLAGIVAQYRAEKHMTEDRVNTKHATIIAQQEIQITALTEKLSAATTELKEAKRKLKTIREVFR